MKKKELIEAKVSELIALGFTAENAQAAAEGLYAFVQEEAQEAVQAAVAEQVESEPAPVQEEAPKPSKRARKGGK